MKYKSDAFEAIHGFAAAMHRVGGLNDAQMREFDESCLAPLPPLDGGEIRAIPKKRSPKINNLSILTGELFNKSKIFIKV